jgi:hypothetical protein
MTAFISGKDFPDAHKLLLEEVTGKICDILLEIESLQSVCK